MKAFGGQAVGATVLFLALWLAPGTASAERVDLSGVTFVQPAGWALQDHSEVRNGLIHKTSTVEVDGLVAVWVKDVGEKTVSRAVFGRRPQKLNVRESGVLPAIRLLVEAMQRSPGIHDFEVDGVNVCEVDGQPSYRIRLRFVAAGAKTEHLLYVVGGEETFVLAFSAPAARYPEEVASFEELVRSTTLPHRASLFHDVSLWLWFSLVLGFLGTTGWKRTYCRSRLADKAPIGRRP